MKSTPARAGKVAFFTCWYLAIAPLSVLGEPAAPSTDPGEPDAYHDRYLASTLPPDISTDDSVPDNPSGLARSLKVDAVTTLLSSHSDGTSDRLDETGVMLESQWDTATFGAWSLDGTYRLQGSGDAVSGDSHGSVRLTERGMPFDGGWNADAGLGDLNAPNVNLARFQPRFFLPTSPMQGLSTEWRGPSGLQWVAGAGEPGIYEGVAVPSFSALGGTVGTLGAQWSPATRWSMGGEIATARDAPLYAGILTADPGRTSETTALLATAWQGSTARAQLNLLQGSSSEAGMGHPSGAWFDAAINQGHTAESFGAFRIDPNLTWAGQLITSDVQGGYYQFDYQSRRWLVDVDLDQAWSVSGRGLDSTFVTANTRYQFARDIGAGTVLNILHSEGPLAWSGESYLDIRNQWGIGRGQLDYTVNDADREAALTLSEGWNATEHSHMSASLGYESISAAGALTGISDSSAMTLSINGNSELTAHVSLDGAIRWDQTVSGSRASGLMANVALNWHVTRDWTVLASYYENRLGSWTELTVTSPLAPPTTTPIEASSQRAVFLTVRYQLAAGQHFAPLGGAPGSGSGRLTGTIYLDANDNGRFDAGEDVAHNVTVILDGRFSTITDASGHFDFPAVVTGHHTITVLPDNLPLPWNVVGDGRVEVEVRTRERTDVSIPAVRHSILTQKAG